MGEEKTRGRKKSGKRGVKSVHVLDQFTFSATFYVDVCTLQVVVLSDLDLHSLMLPRETLHTRS